VFESRRANLSSAGGEGRANAHLDMRGANGVVGGVCGASGS